MEDADRFLEEMKLFFEIYGRKYVLFRPNKRLNAYVYFRNFDEKGLAILVRLPVKNNEAGEAIFTGRNVEIEIKQIKKHYLFSLVDSIIREGWLAVLQDKIEVLTELVLDHVKPCLECGTMRIPRVSRTKVSEADKKPTFFVATYCPKCRRRQNTKFGVGLKSRLHKYLKAKAIQKKMEKK
jgi:hypothetical protein